MLRIKSFFEKRVISIESGGNLWKIQKIVESNFKGFKNISSITNQINGNSINLMGNAFDNIYNFLSKALLKCTYKEALLTEEICNEIKTSIKITYMFGNYKKIGIVCNDAGAANIIFYSIRKRS